MGRWVGRGLLLVAGLAWFGLGPSLPVWDRWWLDASLEWRRPTAPAVSPQVAVFEIGQEDLDTFDSFRAQCDGIASVLQGLRAQSANVLALDFWLSRGQDSDFLNLWKELVGRGDVVLARTWKEGTRLPKADAKVDSALIQVEADWDHRIRAYTLIRRDPRGGEPQPSLALAAYLKLRFQDFTPEMLTPAGEVEWEEPDERGEPRKRRLPNTFLLDERALVDEDTPRNVFRVHSRDLARWSKERATTRLIGKAVFLGYVAPGTGDWGATSLNSRLSKVYVHATALNDLIQDSWRQPAPRSTPALGALVLMGLAAALSRLPGWPWLGGWITGVALILGGAMQVVWRTHQVPPAISLAVVWTVAAGLERWIQHRLHQQRVQALRASADMDDPLVCKVVGDYQLVERIGQGGFASVYRGLPHDSLDPLRSVAIKIVHGASSENPDFRRRFVREIRISAQLEHPNIVRVLGSGDQGGLLYLIMELLQGRSLRHYLQVPRDPWTMHETLLILRPLLQAMDYAHRLPVLHRDLKPENVMVEVEEGSPPAGPWRFCRLKVVDFGLAFDTQSSHITKSGDVFGTMDYLAPERITGVLEDARSDQYAVGVMAYEILAGRSPFPPGTPGEALLFRMTRDPVPLGELRPDLPAALVAAVQRMMERDLEKRFPDMEQALRSLDPL